MPDAFDGLTGKIAPLIRMLGSDADGEVVNAARALRRLLANHALDMHALVERIEHDGESPLAQAEMQKIYDDAYSKGFENGAVRGRLSAVVAAQPIGVFACPVDDGVNGYSWKQIAAHCALNRHVFTGKNLEFIESMPEKLDRYGKPTSGQAKWLSDLFTRKFGGKIE